MLLYDRSIIGSFTEIFGYLRQSSEIAGKCSETIVWLSDNFSRIFGNLWKVFGNVRKIVKKVVTSIFYNKQKITCPLVVDSRPIERKEKTHRMIITIIIIIIHQHSDWPRAPLLVLRIHVILWTSMIIV